MLYNNATAGAINQGDMMKNKLINAGFLTLVFTSIASALAAAGAIGVYLYTLYEKLTVEIQLALLFAAVAYICYLLANQLGRYVNDIAKAK